MLQIAFYIAIGALITVLLFCAYSVRKTIRADRAKARADRRVERAVERQMETYEACCQAVRDTYNSMANEASETRTLVDAAQAPDTLYGIPPFMTMISYPDKSQVLMLGFTSSNLDQLVNESGVLLPPILGPSFRTVLIYQDTSAELFQRLNDLGVPVMLHGGAIMSKPGELVRFKVEDMTYEEVPTDGEGGGSNV